MSVSFRLALCKLQALGFRKPPPLPAVPSLSVRPRPQDFSGAHRLLDLCEMAAAAGEAARVGDLLTKSYKQWANKSEIDLDQFFGSCISYLGDRCKGPRLVWKFIIRSDYRGMRYPTLHAVRWVCSRFKILVFVARDIVSGKASEADMTVGDDMKYKALGASEWIHNHMRDCKAHRLEIQILLGSWGPGSLRERFSELGAASWKTCTRRSWRFCLRARSFLLRSPRRIGTPGSQIS